jgi:leucyl-tRNA synthetase
MYNPKIIEKKWQQYWDENATFQAFNPPFSGNAPEKKAYILDMFPYPSGSGLHVGHPKGYTATDAYSRYLRANGYNVLHTMGWDAFGLPAENYAIKTGRHPRDITVENVAVFKRQIKELGLAYDWSRELDTTDPEYYRWSQWIFSQMVEMGLAYEAEMPVNWCPHLKCVLANEEIVDGKSEVGGHPVERRHMRQWVLKITAYADRLLEDIDAVNWPEGIKEQQRNWIGKSEGCEFRLQKSDDATKYLSVYTTRVDTVFGMGWVVIAPDHPKVDAYITDAQRPACDEYIKNSRAKSDQERLNEGKQKTGVFTGSTVLNPFNNESVQVWIGDYVLGSYGTGAVMGVAAHDTRDYEFAVTYGLPIEKVIVSSAENKEYDVLDEKAGEFMEETDAGIISDDSRELPEGPLAEIFDAMEAIENELPNGPYTDEGFVIKGNGPYDELLDAVLGQSSANARTILMNFAEEKGFGTKKINYKLRDWIFSRQRYWGEPIPVIHLNAEDYASLPVNTSGAKGASIQDENGVQTLLVDGQALSKIYDGLSGKYILETKLPLTLPEVERYEPSDDGQSPLANITEWVNISVASNLRGKRETNTMPQWAGSCWYYLRFMDSNPVNAIASKEAIEYWKQVDCYVGGAEHAVLHLLYARFWHKVLFDLTVVPTNEPFKTLINQGLILSTDGSKMSKSKGDVINPDDIVKEYSADILRTYIFSMSDFRDPAPWDTKSMVGMSRFLDRAFALYSEKPRYTTDDMKAMKLLHKSIKKIGEDIEAFKFNTAIAALIMLVNE